MTPRTSLYKQALILILMSVLLAACAGGIAHRQGVRLLAEGKEEEAVAKFEQAMKAEPDNVEFRLRYRNAKETAIAKLMAQGQAEFGAQHFNEAEALYRRVLSLDQQNSQAANGLSLAAAARKHAQVLADSRKLLDAGKLEEARQRLDSVLQDDPLNPDARELQQQLDDRMGLGRAVVPSLGRGMRRPISIEVRDANLKQVIEMLSRHSGINFVLDREIQPNLTITTFLRQIPVEDALDVILSTHQLQKRVLNDNTLLIYPNTAAKLSEHQDLIVKGIYLANADAKQAVGMLKSVLKIKDAYVDEKLNLLILRETPDTIRLAERALAMLDISEPEVMLEVEVLEVKRSRLTELGIKFPDRLALSPLPGNGKAVTLQDLQSLNASRIGASVSDAVINLKREVGDANILANPRIRARSKEKATIKIGDRVPLITTTTTATGFVAENVQYVDVGLKLEVEPTVYLADEISIRLNLEVSSLVRELRSSTGSISYQIGARNAGTVIRLKDGETQVLGGLINDEDRKTANRFPGLGDLPVVGRLFSSQKNDDQKTELVLSITPRLVRGVAPPKYVPTEFWSGTESRARLKPLYSAATTSLAGMRVATSLSEQPASAATTAVEEALPPPIQPVEAGPNVSLQWGGDVQGKVGQTLELTVYANTHGKISGLPLQIKYDPAVLSLIDAVPGDWVNQGGRADFKKNGAASAGMLFVSQNRKDAPMTGSGTALKVQFKALARTERTIVSLLPTTPIGADNKPAQQTAPAMVGISIQP